MELLGFTLQTSGEVIIGITAILVHRALLREKKLDNFIYREITHEQVFGSVGVVLLVTGYFLQVLY